MCLHVFQLQKIPTSQVTAWKVSKYRVISGPITGKYGPEITPYLVTVLQKSLFLHSSSWDLRG